jgi:hypothetical protein
VDEGRTRFEERQSAQPIFRLGIHCRFPFQLLADFIGESERIRRKFSSQEGHLEDIVFFAAVGREKLYR